MRQARFLLALATLAGLGAVSAGVEARTNSVVTFESKVGIVFVDSKRSKAAYRLFESLNVPVVNKFMRQVKIFAPEDGTFRITCSALSTDYACAVIVYASEYAKLEFKTDHVELDLPEKFSSRYTGVFRQKGGAFHFKTEDENLSIDWSVKNLHIVAHGKVPGRDI